MIPWRLRFTGIRDYGAEEMILENADEHILITGPNGAGKSTISFCMGAVLRSAKVEMEGLKSQNLPEEETWRAAIHFLFKNEGPSRIDAPLYIEFRLLVEQPPKQPIKLRYEIHDGDEMEELELRQAYRSGDANKNNFTAYRRELQYKYKIHPDLYYLIWYQQEVNQFSVMAPEERFRIFSEMHGIDSIQKDWETSLETVKEAHEAFTAATNRQTQHEFNLSIARGKKERFEDHRKRLEENGFLYARTTHQLQLDAAEELEQLASYIEERQFELDELSEGRRIDEIALDGKKEQIRLAKDQQREQEDRLEESNGLLTEKEEQIEVIENEVESLTIELSELQEAYAKLPYSEAETKERLSTAAGQVDELVRTENELKKQAAAAASTIEENRQKQSTLQATIEQWNEKSLQSKELIARYTSSHQLEKDILMIEAAMQNGKQRRDQKTEQLELYKIELSMLKRNQIESSRQQEAIRQLKQQQIRAYPFRHFVKLKDQIPMENERLFDAIKYAIFYDAASCQPTNDLYHVSLKKLVPDRSITELPQLGLEMQDGLSVKEQNNAARVLWWVEQFFKTDQPQLQKGVLVDKQGMRGAQEQNTFILSKKALEARRQNVQQQVARLQTEIATLNEQLSRSNEQFRVWNADVQKVKEAEAFLSSRAEQQYRMEQLALLKTEQLRLEKAKHELETGALEAWKETYEKQRIVDELNEQLAVYEQFGRQTEKIERLQRLNLQLKQLKVDAASLRKMIQKIQGELDKLQQIIWQYHRDLNDLEERLNDNERTMAQVLKQKTDKEDERIAVSRYASERKEEMEELKLLIPKLVERAIAGERLEESKYNLQYRQNQAKVEFQNALNEKDIDPNAVENFRTLEQEVNRKKEELTAAKNLLEENEERAIQNERRLETAIQMQVSRINMLFQQYMGEFQFEGKIVYEKFTDKKGRPVFKLFIHVRKEGHRGKFEDVSLKARGGRVGKGVSGGEESLASLLFALSLLQNLENRAGFIVLDEFDSALDDARKATVFQLYANKLQRKLIILSPKAHENEYYDQFSKAFIVSHDPKELKSKLRGIHISG